MSEWDDEEETTGDTLRETIFDALGSALSRLLPKEEADLQVVEEILSDGWSQLTHLKLARLKGRAVHERDIDFALRYPGDLNRSQGMQAWDPKLIKLDLEAERHGRELPPPIGAPRLFLSYCWSWGKQSSDMQIIDFFAGDLFNRGYDLVFDRDPRHFEKGLSAEDLLLLLPSCTHFLALITKEYTDRIMNPGHHRTSPVRQEWALATNLSRSNKRPVFMGLWFSGNELPRPFTPDTVLDFRGYEGAQLKDRVFPVCEFTVVGQRPDGSARMIGPLKRVEVPHAIKVLESDGGIESISVYDITTRLHKESSK